MSEPCQFRAGCPHPASYFIRYEDEVCGTCAACVDCTAEARANDPLDYIESVSSLRSLARSVAATEGQQQ